MNMKSLGFQQVRWAQKLFKYYFQIDYQYSKINEAVDALLCFFQRSQAKENELKIENTWILHKLQFLLTNTSILGLNTSAKWSPLHHDLICGTYTLF